jgi:hypothetical protein
MENKIERDEASEERMATLPIRVLGVLDQFDADAGAVEGPRSR